MIVNFIYMNEVKLSDITERKFTMKIDVDGYQVETDDGFVDITSICETIPYKKYRIKTDDGFSLECADKHIVFLQDYSEIYAEDLKIGDYIITEKGKSKVSSVESCGEEEKMYDLQLADGSNHRYYTNGVLSHNTLIAKKLADEIFGDEHALIRIDMSEYSEKSSVAKLTGAAPGYVGYENGGQLTEAIKNKPHCVLLLDEIEKADPDVYNLFLQLFDEGRLTDSTGQVVNFKNVIVLMTSNIGAQQASELGHGLGFVNDDASNEKSIIDKAMKKKFTPEFLNRIDKIVYFNKLSDDDLRKIVKIEIDNFKKRLNDIDYSMDYTDDVVDYLHAAAVKEKEFGARPILRLIQNSIEDKITDLMLEHEYKPHYVFHAKCTDNSIDIS